MMLPPDYLAKIFSTFRTLDIYAEPLTHKRSLLLFFVTYFDKKQEQIGSWRTCFIFDQSIVKHYSNSFRATGTFL